MSGIPSFVSLIFKTTKVTVLMQYQKTVLEYAIRKVQDTNLGLDMNGIHQVLAYADDVDVIGNDIRTIEKKNTGVLLILVRILV